MSSWIRPRDGGEWHRVADASLEAGVSSGTIHLLCGGTLEAAGGWQEAVPEIVPADDQHRRCWERAEREAYWRQQWRPGNIAEIVQDLATRAAPSHAPFRVDFRPGSPMVLAVQTASGRIVVGSGPSLVTAAGDLLASVEASAVAG